MKGKGRLSQNWLSFLRDDTNKTRAILIKANDTNALVIELITLPVLQEFGLDKLWVAFGEGQADMNPST